MLDRLAQVLAPDEISVAPKDLEADATGPSGQRLPETPLAVIRPATVASVQIVFKIAGASGAKVVPRGAGTGAPGTTRFPDGALVLSTERLNKIIRIEPDNEMAVVQPGVTTAHLDAAAGARFDVHAPTCQQRDHLHRRRHRHPRRKSAPHQSRGHPGIRAGSDRCTARRVAVADRPRNDRGRGGE